MNQEKQPDALSLADDLEAPSLWPTDIRNVAAAELRRLHAENSAQRAELVAEAARTAEEKLRADQMTEQHRMQCNISKSAVATLLGLGYTDRGGEQWVSPIGKAPDFNLLDAANAQIAELQAQLSAIGAGGVEQLRKREQSVPWDNFPSYLIDHCEGDTITEEGLQHALAAMLANPQYAAATAHGGENP